MQHVTTVESTVKVPYVADIKKLKKTTDLPPEERQALEENSVPDTLYIRQLKQKDQLLFPKSSTLIRKHPIKYTIKNGCISFQGKHPSIVVSPSFFILFLPFVWQHL